MASRRQFLVDVGFRAGLRRLRGLAVRPPRLDRFAPQSTLELPEHTVLRARVPAVDIHNHVGRWLHRRGEWMAPDVGRLVAQMDDCNIAALVNLDGRWGSELGENIRRYDQTYPGRFVTFCHLDWSVLAGRGGTNRLVGSLTEARDRGAGGLKVWKDLGRSVRDRNGDLVLPDHPELEDVWAAAGELGLPILIHTGDPKAFFQPVDRFNERVEELLRHRSASWHVAGFPSHQRLLEALDGAVAGAPGANWIAAHVASNVEDLGWVSQLLQRHPHLHVDISARAGDLGRQPRAARAFVTRHSDRVLFGTDVFPVRLDEIRVYFRLLETEDEAFPYSTAPTPPAGRWQISGLGLPDDVLQRVYRDNALRLLPMLRASGGVRTDDPMQRGPG